MKTSDKARLAKGALLALAIWPAIHHALVVGYGLNPWHFFGMAMYCKPRAPLGVDLLDASGQPLPFERMPAAVDALVTEYGERRRAWGELLPPDGLARDLFAEVPWLRHVEIVVTSFEFRASAAHFERAESKYVYDR